MDSPKRPGKGLCLANQVAKGKDPLEKRREGCRKQVALGQPAIDRAGDARDPAQNGQMGESPSMKAGNGNSNQAAASRDISIIP